MGGMNDPAERVLVYLLALLSKGDRANFTAAEIAGFKALTAAIGQYWRKGQE